MSLEKAKLFQNGRSQAVRLPKAFRFEGKEVWVKRVGDAILLLPLQHPWETLFSSLDVFTGDYMTDRAQPDQQDRTEWFD